MPFSARTRLCPFCSTPTVPDPPAAPVCEQCGRVLVIHHTEWPMVLKWWLVADFARTRFLPWLTEQSVWEDLLRASLNGIRAGKGPNPNGAHITMSTSAVELYPLAVQRAQAWKLAGSHLGAAPADAKPSHAASHARTET